MKRIIITCFLFAIYSFANSQQIENIVFTQQQKVLTVTYNLTDAKQGQTFDVSLFYRINNSGWATIANSQLQGDVGTDLTAGNNKTITWIPTSYGVDIDGTLQFKVKAKIHNPPPTQTDNNNANTPDNMVFVQGGTFQMGSNNVDSDEKPVHSVTVSSFYISKYEVTNEEFIVFLNAKNVSSSGSYNGNELIDMDDTDCAIGYSNGKFYFKGSSSADNKKCPVIEVTWYGANEYCKWLSQTTGKTYRLPTEAEWEYAAGGGSSSRTKWAGTNYKLFLRSYAWYRSNSGSKTHPVGTKSPNSLGIYDMSGNVWEWCSDWYGSYSSSSQTNPQGASSGSSRVGRGGSWSGLASYCRVANRSYDTPTGSNLNLGFRVCQED